MPVARPLWGSRSENTSGRETGRSLPRVGVGFALCSTGDFTNHAYAGVLVVAERLLVGDSTRPTLSVFPAPGWRCEYLPIDNGGWRIVHDQL